MLSIIKTLTIAADVIFTIIILWFCWPLRWYRQEDRSSIIGFTAMIVLYVLNIYLLLG